tara:strand:+ start:372 stop:785 length:414 start_codon:yes stop_codon:yes gene_type:complete
MANYSQGASGKGVTLIQEQLLKYFKATGSTANLSAVLGDAGVQSFNSEVDKQYFGPATTALVKKFQGDKGLTVDGIVGPITLAALGLAAKTSGTTALAPSASNGAAITQQPWFVPTLAGGLLLLVVGGVYMYRRRAR